jgi:hypothetical protein
LGRGQKVHFAVDRETESIIRTTLHIKDIPLTNEHILAFSLHNQIAIQGPNNYRAFKDKAESLLQKPLIGMFLSPDARTAYKRCKEVFFSEKPRDLFQLYGAQVQRLPTDTALTNTCDRIEHSSSVAYLKEKGALPTLHEDLESLQSMKAVLPTHVQDIPEEIGAGVQIQVATQTQTSTQTLTQVQFISNPQEIKRDKFLDFGEYLESLASAKDFSAATPPYTQKTIKENPVTSIQNVFEPEKETAKYASLFPNNFFASLNLFPCDVEEFTPLTTYCQPFSYMLYVRDTKTKAIHSILLNQQDAVALLETSFPQKKSRYEIVLANIHSGEMFAHGSSKRLKTHLAKDMDFLIRRVQAKMLSGNMNLSFQEQAAFIAWCSSLGEEGFSQVWDLCLKYIGVTHPEASETMWVLYPIIQDQGISVTTNLLKQLIATLPQDPQREILEQHLAFLEKNKKVTVEIMQDILNLAQKS